MKRVLVLTLILALSLNTSQLSALDASSFQHAPPSPNEIELAAGSKDMTAPIKVPISIPAAGIKRIRLFVLTPTGYQIRPLEREKDEFKGWLDFAGLSLVRYYFQVETKEGKIFESQLYSIRRPSDPSSEERIKRSLAEAESLSATLSQLERQLAYLRIEDPAKYRERALEERKFALNALASATLEYSRLLTEVESGLAALRQQASRMTDPRRTEVQRLIVSEIEPALQEVK